MSWTPIVWDKISSFNPPGALVKKGFLTRQIKGPSGVTMATYGSVAIHKDYVLKTVRAFHLKYQEMKTINNFCKQ